MAAAARGESGKGESTEGPGSLALAAGPTEERTFEIAADIDEVSIGRRPGVELELPFPTVSASHARLYRGELSAEWWVEDLGSTNGSWVEGRRLPVRQPAPVRAGQRLRIGTVDLVFEGWSEAPRGAESTATIARRLIGDLFGAIGGEVPMLAREWGAVQPPALRLSVRDRRYLAGRAEGCDLILAGDHVSREHLAVVRRWDGVVVEDLGSKNGVLVNGQRVSGELKLRDGDRLEVGPTALRLNDPEDRYLRQLQELSSDAPATAPAPPADVSPAVPAATTGSTTAEPQQPKVEIGTSPEPRRSARLPIIIATIVALSALAGLLALLWGTA